MTLDPDPAVDAAHVRAAKQMMTRRFVPKLAAANVPYVAEIVHFLTDADSIGEAVCRRAAALRPAAVCMAKHQRGRLSEFCEFSRVLGRTVEAGNLLETNPLTDNYRNKNCSPRLLDQV